MGQSARSEHVDALDGETVAAARTRQRAQGREDDGRRDGVCRRPRRPPDPCGGSLPDPPAAREELAFTGRGLDAVRNLVARCGAHAGLADTSREELVLAVNELATNSVQHGGGGGALRVWREPGALVCDVRDRGFLRDPSVGRLPPPVDQHGGRGLWLVNRLCDRVQIRSSPDGTLVRVQMRIGR
jgi:anti-sigma regulatory factor (Ser/Thr protein kinase)